MTFKKVELRNKDGRLEKWGRRGGRGRRKIAEREREREKEMVTLTGGNKSAEEERRRRAVDWMPCRKEMK